MNPHEHNDSNRPASGSATVADQSRPRRDRDIAALAGEAAGHRLWRRLDPCEIDDLRAALADVLHVDVARDRFDAAEIDRWSVAVAAGCDGDGDGVHLGRLFLRNDVPMALIADSTDATAEAGR